jgi:hypothetical protein
MAALRQRNITALQRSLTTALRSPMVEVEVVRAAAAVAVEVPMVAEAAVVATEAVSF